MTVTSAAAITASRSTPLRLAPSTHIWPGSTPAERGVARHLTRRCVPAAIHAGPQVGEPGGDLVSQPGAARLGLGIDRQDVGEQVDHRQLTPGASPTQYPASLPAASRAARALAAIRSAPGASM